MSGEPLLRIYEPAEAQAALLARKPVGDVDVTPALTAEWRAIRYVSTATVSFGFRRAECEHALDGFGFVVSARSKSRLMACTWT